MQTLDRALSTSLDFHEEDSLYASHNFHPFPAKFPPQLPRHFICQLTEPGEVVLDPMSGSGTTVLEAHLNGRQGIACDIDPLALLITQVKTTPLDGQMVAQAGAELVNRAQQRLQRQGARVGDKWRNGWDGQTQKFIDYWFNGQTQLQLFSLLTEIEAVPDASLQRFFQVAFSAVIIAKTGGVSLALDLAHTRPHRAQQVLMEDEFFTTVGNKPIRPGRERFVTKIVRSAFREFEQRVRRNVAGLLPAQTGLLPPILLQGNVQSLPLAANSADLIITSPPYASNAIDYLRSHKFSLVWFGHGVAKLRKKRQEYMGHTAAKNQQLTKPLPTLPARVVEAVQQLNGTQGESLAHYFAEMEQALAEMWRLLKPGKAAIIVIGNSVIRGKDAQIPACLATLAERQGFRLASLVERRLDRNRRMMPAHHQPITTSPIHQRMTHEYIIGLEK